MPERKVVTWNPMICGLASQGHVEVPLILILEYEEKGNCCLLLMMSHSLGVLSV
jgi:hypothetical protein